MVTMIDEIYDRNYQAGRTELNAAIVAGFTRARPGDRQRLRGPQPDRI